MKLSELNIMPIWNADTKRYENKIEDELINKIVFSDIDDNQKVGQYAVVFGTSRKIEMEARVKKAIELYQLGRVKKVLFTGGKNGISSIKRNQTPKKIQEENKDISYLFQDELGEAERMKSYAIKRGLPSSAILLDEQSNNSVNTIKSLPNFLNIKEGDNIIFISSAYHLKRCLALAKKYSTIPLTYSLVSANTGYFEEENYNSSSLGKELLNFEANHLIRLAREKEIYDLEIEWEKDQCMKFLNSKN